jgi:hypothetical protein
VLEVGDSCFFIFGIFHQGWVRSYQCERGHAHHLSGLLQSLVTVCETSGERLLSGRLGAGRFSGEGLSACVRSTISLISLPRFSLVASGEDYLSSISEQKFLVDVFTFLGFWSVHNLYQLLVPSLWSCFAQVPVLSLDPLAASC